MAQILLGQLRQGQVAGQVNLPGHCRGVEPGEAPRGIPSGLGVRGKGAAC